MAFSSSSSSSSASTPSTIARPSSTIDNNLLFTSLFCPRIDASPLCRTITSSHQLSRFTSTVYLPLWHWTNSQASSETALRRATLLMLKWYTFTFMKTTSCWCSVQLALQGKSVIELLLAIIVNFTTCSETLRMAPFTQLCARWPFLRW